MIEVLPGAGGAHQGHALPGRDREVDVLQHPLRLAVLRGVCRRRRRTRRRSGPAPRPGARATPGACTSSGVSSRAKIRSDDAIACCRMLNFSERSEMGRQKRSEYWTKATSAPRVSAPVSTPRPAVEQDERGGHRGQQLDGGVEDRVVEDLVHVRVGVLAVDLRERGHVALLAAEELHHRHPGDVLLQEGVDARDPLAHLAEGGRATRGGTSWSPRRRAGSPRR